MNYILKPRSSRARAPAFQAGINLPELAGSNPSFLHAYHQEHGAANFGNIQSANLSPNVLVAGRQILPRC